MEKFINVSSCQKLSEWSTILQSYCKNKNGAIFMPQCIFRMNRIEAYVHTNLRSSRNYVLLTPGCYMKCRMFTCRRGAVDAVVGRLLKFGFFSRSLSEVESTG